MELWVGAIILGFLYAFLTLGSFLTFRVLHFPDITVDGSLTAGAATSAVLIAAGWNPFLTLGLAFLAGAAAGSVTAAINTRIKIDGLLAGILVMTGLYSVNLHLMGRSNISLINHTTFVSCLEKINPGLPAEIWLLVCLVPIMALFWIAASLFFKTDLGISMTATGNNPTMAAAAGVNVERMKIFGISLANGLTGLSGAVVAQYQGFADVGMGIGTVVTGLASVIIGETIFPLRSIYAKIFSAILGSVVFRLMIALALSAGLNPIDLKLLTAVFVLGALVLPGTFAKWPKARAAFAGFPRSATNLRRIRIALPGVAIAVLVLWSAVHFSQHGVIGTKICRIGIVQISDHAMLNTTRESFLKEMNVQGYLEGKNCAFLYRNAHSDTATINNILDDFLRQDVSLVVAISTPCTQAAINRIKDRPVLFATVADPFVIGAGKSDTEHKPNVTGVYGAVPMDVLLEKVRATLPGAVRIGCIWDPSQINAVVNVEDFRKAVERHPELTFVGTAVSGTSEVYQGVLSLVQRGVDVMVLPPDNVIYSAFESVVKAAKPRKIPIFITDVERIQDGALAALGYDYTSSGIQAAHLAERILKGEDPGRIPFQKYSHLTFALNTEVARELGVKFPPAIVSSATRIYGDKSAPCLGGLQASTEKAPSPGRVRRLALFHFTDSETVMRAVKGFMDELEKGDFLRRHAVKVDRISAQNDWNLAQAIARDIVRKKYDFVVTLSTPTLQMMVRTNREIPAVFGMVSDPYSLGAAKTPRDHPANLTGVATSPPVESALKIMRELFPKARKIGMVWNPSEACSEASMHRARKAAPAYGFELVEATAGSTGEVLDAVKSLAAKGIDLFFTSNDNTISLAVGSVAAFLHQQRIPYFSNTPVHVEQGAFLAIGADYEEVGKETGRMTREVVSGKSPKTIPILEFVPERVYINRGLANEYGVKLPQPLAEHATFIKR
ncbi:MAG: ABC transporter substrate binding protein [Syntrophobacteraceae bacterium]|nr:ABC transporter substrate binding protein [Syntrophobacteraceae bacterium]